MTLDQTWDSLGYVNYEHITILLNFYGSLWIYVHDRIIRTPNSGAKRSIGPEKNTNQRAKA